MHSDELSPCSPYLPTIDSFSLCPSKAYTVQPSVATGNLQLSQSMLTPALPSCYSISLCPSKYHTDRPSVDRLTTAESGPNSHQYSLQQLLLTVPSKYHTAACKSILAGRDQSPRSMLLPSSSTAQSPVWVSFPGDSATYLSILKQEKIISCLTQ